MTVINTNVKSILAQNALTVNNRSLTKAMEQLSTGKRINTASDDAAGLAIVSRMTAQIKALDQSVRNANDAISMMQTAEGATKEITNMLERMRVLAVQSSNDTYSDTDRQAMQDEVGQLSDEITRISNNTQWNGISVLKDGATYSYQVGTEGDTASQITMKFEKMSSNELAVDALAVDTNANSQLAIESIDSAITTVDTFRATLGSKINRMTSAADNLANVSMNTTASRSRIEDADYAQSTTELARTQIIQQAATAMLAQANQQPQSVLTLLK